MRVLVSRPEDADAQGTGLGTGGSIWRGLSSPEPKGAGEMLPKDT